MLSGKRILLVIGGGLAPYNGLALIQRLRERGAAALSGERAHTALFDRESEADIGHIRLGREADAVVVAPGTANLMAKMAGGHADDLAATVLLATTLPILIAPAMNVRMWLHPATQRNLAVLQADGIHVVGPNEGAMAEAEHGPGRMAEPLEIAAAAERLLAAAQPPPRVVGGLRAGSSRRHRDLRGGRCGLARRQCRGAEDQEEAGRAARAVPRREPGHPRH